MAMRPGAAAVAGGALLALLGQGTATAQEREVSGGYVGWTLDSGGLTLGGSARPAWLPATGGTADPATGALTLELGGTAGLTPPAGTAPPLPLADLRLSLDGDSGALRARTAVDGEAHELALAEVKPGTPVVRAGGATWTGLEATLTEEGAALLARWSGLEFDAGDGLGRFDVTVGTGTAAPPATTPPAEPSTGPSAPAADPTAPTPVPSTPATDPSASVAATELTAGSRQTVTGEGFEPGEVVLVAIDQDTRYQVTADEQGRASRAFPVYTTATEGAHTVELHTVTGDRRAAADFTVRTP
ncbi:HtaA domain-containing protein [Streptomyces sp. NPDC003832]